MFLQTSNEGGNMPDKCAIDYTLHTAVGEVAGEARRFYLQEKHITQTFERAERERKSVLPSTGISPNP
jgi:hypothetical protein